jgi:type IV pilus assembly protein PilC
MKKFIYEARDQTSNKIVKSIVQANSENEAGKLLIKQGFVPLSIKEQTDDSNPLSRLSSRITTKDKIVFTRQLATLIGAGLPLSQSLHTVLEQTENKKMQAVVQEVITLVEGGKRLSESFARYPKVFDPVFLAMVGAGEASGTLDKSLQRVANQQEKDADTKGKIKGALTYPIIVLVVILGVIAFMLFTVVPQVEKLYHDLKRDLPFLTKAMVEVASFLSSFWWLTLLIAGLIVFFIIRFLKTEPGAKFKDSFKLNVPIFGQMFKKLYMARFARTGQTLLASGVTMLSVLKITSEAVSNSIIKTSIMRSAEKVKGGKALSVAMSGEDYILPLVPQMISIGEQSGHIDEMMGKLAQIYEDELDQQIRSISTAIEPALMVVLAIVAGGMVAAILLPIYGLINSAPI